MSKLRGRKSWRLTRIYYNMQGAAIEELNMPKAIWNGTVLAEAERVRLVLIGGVTG